MNCKQCGAPLTKGNIKVVRPRGKKRPFRIHRHCPEPTGLPRMPQEAVKELVKPEVFTGKPDHGETHSWKGDTAGDVFQRPQDSTGAPIVVEGVLDYPDPIRYRYFITRATAEKLQRAIKGGQVGITVEVIPVPEDQVERAPEDYADLVEVTINWKDE